MPIILQTFDDVTAEIKRLWDQLDLLRTKNIDLSRRRVINASRSVNLNDYIIREELIEVIDSIPEAIIRTPTSLISRTSTKRLSVKTWR